MIMLFVVMILVAAWYVDIRAYFAGRKKGREEAFSAVSARLLAVEETALAMADSTIAALNMLPPEERAARVKAFLAATDALLSECSCVDHDDDES